MPVLVRSLGAALVAALLSTGLPASAQTAAPWWQMLDTLPEGLTVLAMDSSYAVRGATAESIARELDRLGPKKDGRSFHGFHQAPWRWRYRTERTGADRCQLSEFAVVVRSVVTLPELASDLPVAPELRDAWDRYLANLRAHEEGHRGIVVQALRQFRARARSARPHPCGSIQAHFESMTGDTEAQIREAQDAYDRETDFGRTQGAVWPPARGPSLSL